MTTTTTLALDQAVERTIRTALDGTGIIFRRTLRRTGLACDTDNQLELIGGPYVAGFRTEWDALVTGGRGGFYYDSTWRHPDTHETIPSFLHRILWDGSSPAGRLNIDGDDRQAPVGLYAYVRSPQDWLNFEVRFSDRR